MGGFGELRITIQYSDPVLFLTSGVLLFLIYVRSRLRNQLPLPPSPTCLPLVGNVLQVPRSAPWERFREWNLKYGPIVSFKVGSRTIILLGTRTVVRDLFEKRAHIYSTRPRFIVASEYTLKGLPALLPYDKNWLALHRLETTVLNPRITTGTLPIHGMAAKHLLYSILGDPDHDLSDHLHNYAGSVFSTLFYGAHMGSETPEDQHLMRTIYHEPSKCISIEHWMVEMFPALEHFPGVASRCRQKGEMLHGVFHRAFGPKLEAAQNCQWWNMFKHLSKNRPEGLSDRDFLMVITELELAARTTGPLSLSLFAVMAALHPNEMRRVHDEIDQVVGSARLPTFDDQDNLPYLQAFMTECQRLYPLVPLSFARAAMRDDSYMGLRIPADAIIVPNQWALNRDPAIYDDPTSFVPQRWIDSPSLPPPGTFGYGRRICPGRHIANASLFIAMASIAWALDYQKLPGLSAESGLARSMLFCPQTSSVRVSFRSQGHAAVVKREWEAVNPDMSLTLNEIGDMLGSH
ncbi:cytochrome P450 [Aspergillus pseudoustus]|uniref:Cytochrome P450 n=1 Tax=Aspergillus pseudoustus TaxID=1810923 RepID=A0ABR4JF06_9EURO